MGEGIWEKEGQSSRLEKTTARFNPKGKEKQIRAKGMGEANVLTEKRNETRRKDIELQTRREDEVSFGIGGRRNLSSKFKKKNGRFWKGGGGILCFTYSSLRGKGKHEKAGDILYEVEGDEGSEAQVSGVLRSGRGWTSIGAKFIKEKKESIALRRVKKSDRRKHDRAFTLEKKCNTLLSAILREKLHEQIMWQSRRAKGS